MGGEHSAGGSSGLAELIDKYGEQIFADLHEYAGGLNLVQALRDGSGYSPRQLLTLIQHLPMESRTIAAIRGGDEYRGWGVDRYLSTNILDSINDLTYAFVSANSKRKPKPPRRSWRPDSKPKKTSNPFAAHIAAARREREK